MDVEGELTQQDLEALQGGGPKSMVLLLSCALRKRTDGTRRASSTIEFVGGGLLRAIVGEIYMTVGAAK